MQGALQGLLNTFAGLLGAFSPAAKAVTAAVLPLATALVNFALAGSFNTTSIVVLACGAATSLLVYFVPNLEKKPAPAPKKTTKRA